MTMWVTEFGYPNQDSETTETFFNQSISYLDRLAYVAAHVLSNTPNHRTDKIIAMSPTTHGSELSAQTSAMSDPTALF